MCTWWIMPGFVYRMTLTVSSYRVAVKFPELSVGAGDHWIVTMNVLTRILLDDPYGLLGCWLPFSSTMYKTLDHSPWNIFNEWGGGLVTDPISIKSPLSRSMTQVVDLGQVACGRHIVLATFVWINGGYRLCSMITNWR